MWCTKHGTHLGREAAGDGVDLAPELANLVPANHANVLAACCPPNGDVGATRDQLHVNAAGVSNRESAGPNRGRERKQFAEQAVEGTHRKLRRSTRSGHWASSMPSASMCSKS